jgi:uncharacterized protein (TIGR02444 family)
MNLEPSEEEALAGRFWDFAEALYSKPGLRKIFLDLQDNYGLDINLLLFCLFAGAAGYGIRPTAELYAAADIVRLWSEEITNRLRRTRRALDKRKVKRIVPRTKPLEEAILRIELDAERIAQGLILKTALAGPAAAFPDPKVAAKANLAIYCDYAGVTESQDIGKAMELLCRTAFDDDTRSASCL